MEYYVIIPAHNEASHLETLLASLLAQSLTPKKVVIVNDNSTDTTEHIIDAHLKKSKLIYKQTIVSSEEHMPGSKVINAFNHGLAILDDEYDFIVKLDADLILPKTYFEKLASCFKNDAKLGIAGGFIYEQNSKGVWLRNHTMDEDHVRGAFKAYTKPCFKAIGGLKNAMGWDTVDELLAKYHGYGIKTLPSLQVKHQRPVRQSYAKKAKRLQGCAMYTMRYGFWISLIASLKMAYTQQSARVFWDNLLGYVEGYRNKTPYLVSKQEGAFIRKLRWQNIKQKLSTKKTI